MSMLAPVIHGPVWPLLSSDGGLVVACGVCGGAGRRFRWGGFPVLAATLAAAPLAGGVQALGVHYFSKHGTHWSCWAVWLRDDVAGALDAGPGQPVAPPADNAALAAVLDLYNLTAR